MVDEDFAWRLAQELVRIDSSDPGAYEGEIEHFIKRLIEQQLAQLDSPALNAVQIEELEVLPGRRNLMITVPGASNEARLVYICHMDTVTLGDGWDADTPPLGATVRDDKLYGRGACDMKGGLACTIAALLHTFERIAAKGALPHRGFSLICSVDEEDFMRGSEAAIDAGWVGSREWVLDTEPTDGQIQVAHKGRTWFEIEMTGVTAHASQPWKGADAVAAMAEAEPEMCVGAGTVLTVEQVEQARAAGAKFIVSPGYNEDVVKHCIDIDLPVLPATVTPSEATAAVNLGLKVTKFFPAAQYGGLNTIKALAAPFVGHRFMPTGGVSTANVEEYLSSSAIIACGGTWMVKPALFADGDFSKVEQIAREAMDVVKKVRA